MEEIKIDKYKINAVGDVFINAKTKDNPFEFVKKNLANDIFLFNLETVVIEDESSYNVSHKSVNLSTDKNKLGYLNLSDTNIACIANNHIYDLGNSGYQETIKNLNERNIKVEGIQISELDFNIYEKNNVTFALANVYLQNTKLTNSIDIDLNNFISKINKIKDKVDFIILSLHWGHENIAYPSPEQKEIAKSLIEMGVDIIIGHHPHYLQGIEKYKEGIIFYSLGNFNFHHYDIKNSIYNDLSCIVKLELRKSNNHKEIEYEIIPIRINDNYQPEVIKEKKVKNNFFNYLDCLSNKIIDDSFTWRFWYSTLFKNYMKGNLNSWKIRIKKYGIKEFLKSCIWLLRPFNLLLYYHFLISLLEKKKENVCDFQKD